ncbi:hypothetical protein FEM48_Zijuj12G0102100 [Ziziphus jujuba var. spinosa]|uniref:F-box domain-containing protein n=1 Tax=Ziziphus jujuba var. spinosa TaxID=714518 RepID=A0A978UCQ5_ZIZJJ|nr:hypothetical protein FEM48_Zijuj12G0102100 [Ziziphus jujuba var. spinosa]
MEYDFSPAKKTVPLREEQEDMDMLSKLPHEIVESIMCLLSMEEAVGTRMICRRWEKLWMNTVRFTHRLDFHFSRCDEGEKTTSSIVNWVNQVMKLDDHGQTLEDLTIKACNLNSDHSDHINRWIEFAAQKIVKNLYLDFNTKNSRSPTGQPYSFVTNFPSLYWLRELYINRIQVTKKVVDRLFSKSPFLERFSLIDSPCLHKLVSHPSWHQIPTMTQLGHLDPVLFNVPASRCSGFLMAAPFLHTFQIST